MRYWWRDVSGYDDDDLVHYHTNFPDSFLEGVGLFFRNGHLVEGGIVQGEVLVVDWSLRNKYMELVAHLGSDNYNFRRNDIHNFYYWYMQNSEIGHNYTLNEEHFAIINNEYNSPVVHLFWEMIEVNSDWIKEGF
tara:strand:- start:133 stop:537 length:405 start_codon:yes stop_codon:yes gene_type:complete